MIKSILYQTRSLCLLLFVVGCAGSGPGKNGPKIGSYSTSIGITFRNEYSGVLRYILVEKYKYLVIRSEESSREIYVETDWKDRPVFADEVDLRITAAQTKFIVKARLRHAGQYNVRFYAENQFQYNGRSFWEPGPVSNMLREYLDEIARDLRIEYKLLY